MKFYIELFLKNENEVRNAYPSAVKIVPYMGKWAVFDTWDDYETWKRQV